VELTRGFTWVTETTFGHIFRNGVWVPHSKQCGPGCSQVKEHISGEQNILGDVKTFGECAKIVFSHLGRDRDYKNWGPEQF